MGRAAPVFSCHPVFLTEDKVQLYPQSCPDTDKQESVPTSQARGPHTTTPSRPPAWSRGSQTTCSSSSLGQASHRPLQSRSWWHGLGLGNRRLRACRQEHSGQVEGAGGCGVWAAGVGGEPCAPPGMTLHLAASRLGSSEPTAAGAPCTVGAQAPRVSGEGGSSHPHTCAALGVTSSAKSPLQDTPPRRCQGFSECCPEARPQDPTHVGTPRPGSTGLRPCEVPECPEHWGPSQRVSEAGLGLGLEDRRAEAQG